MSRRARTLASRSFPWTGLDPERRNAILLIAGIALVVGIALALVAYGYYSDRIAPRHETVLKVGSRTFDYAFLERRARAELLLGRIDRRGIPQGVALTLAQIEREEVMRRTAPSNGVTAIKEEIEARIRTKLGAKEDEPRDVFAARYRDELQRLGLTQAEYRDIALAEVLEKALRSQIEAGVPGRTDFVSLRVIEVDTKEAAVAAKQRIERDESGKLDTSFATVALAVSTHSTKNAGGELGWLPRGALAPAIEAAAFAKIGLSDVIEMDGRFFLIFARGTEERDVTDADRGWIVGQSLSELLNKTREDAGSKITVTQEQVQEIAISISHSLG